jgi:phosphatidylethanolamine/phosphatidyl-N-methylethanolamine N-methyltransferase
VKRKAAALRHERALFLRKFLRAPVQIGAVAPSSAGLAAAITTGIGLEQAQCVVELGPGTGAFTGAIVSRLRPDVKLLAVELDPVFASTVQARFPQVRVVNGPAEGLAGYFDGPTGAVDCVVSGLPWAIFSLEQQTRILDAVLLALRPGGWFTTFAYAHASWLGPGLRFRRLLEANFSSVARTSVVWRNLPPAFVYRCRR